MNYIITGTNLFNVYSYSSITYSENRYAGIFIIERIFSFAILKPDFNVSYFYQSFMLH